MIKHFIKAARLRTLPLSLSGIITGSLLAAADGAFSIQICVLAMLTTIGFQIISNFANDYGDGVKGTDNAERVGPERAIQSGVISPKQMMRAIVITVVFTLCIALFLIYTAFGKEDIVNILIFLVLGIISIAAAIKYTVGSKAYGYHGLGDVFVLLFFGFLGVCGSYYLYGKTLGIEMALPALSIGLLSVGVLNLNNLRDRRADANSGKHTLVVKIGAKAGKIYHYLLLITAFISALLYACLRYETLYNFLFVLAFIPITFHGFTVYKCKDDSALDPELKKLALSTLLFAVLYGTGFLI